MRSTADKILACSATEGARANPPRLNRLRGDSEPGSGMMVKKPKGGGKPVSVVTILVIVVLVLLAIYLAKRVL